MRFQLESRQTQLLEVMDQLESILRAPVPPSIVVLGELRLAWGDMVGDQYRLKEEVFGRLRGFGVVHVDRQIARCRSAMLALQVAYRFHCVDWGADAIVADWPGYVASARRLAVRLRGLIEMDRAQLYPLIDQLIGAATDTPPGPDVFARALGGVGQAAA